MLRHFPNGLRQGFARDLACKIRLILFCLQDKDGIAMAARRMSVELQTKSAKISRVRSELTLQAGKEVEHGRHLSRMSHLFPGTGETVPRSAGDGGRLMRSFNGNNRYSSSTPIERTPSSIIDDVIKSTLLCDRE